MNKERDLRLWILGGLSTAAVAIAVAAVTIQRPAAPVTLAQTAPNPGAAPDSAGASPALVAPAASVDPGAVTPASVTPAASSPSPPESAADSPATAAASADQSPEGQPGQIWVCTTKGVKTYSNNPCGEHPSLLEVGPINTMAPATPVRYARAYPVQPQYAAYNDPRAQSYADGDSDQDDADNGANTYTIVQGVAVLARRRPDRHRPGPPYHHAAAPDNHGAAPAHRVSAPAPHKF